MRDYEQPISLRIVFVEMVLYEWQPTIGTVHCGSVSAISGLKTPPTRVLWDNTVRLGNRTYQNEKVIIDFTIKHV